MQIYDEREDYGPAVDFFRRVAPRSHFKIARIGFGIALCFVIVGLAAMGLAS